MILSIKKIDLIGGVSGCFIGASIIFVGHTIKTPSVVEIGVAILAASVVYLLFRRKLCDLTDKVSLPPNKSLTLILNIIFSFAFAASIFLAHTHLHRPQLYFLLTAISVATIAAETLLSPRKAQIWLILLKIVLVSLSLRGGLLYEFPGFYGVDPWFHMSVVKTWIDIGHIVAQSPTMLFGRYTSYAGFPVLHLEIMVTEMITGLNPKDSLFLSIGIFYVASIIFVFLVSQYLLGTAGGLLAALAICINQFHIVWGAWLIPTSLGVGIFAMILYFVFVGCSSVRNSLLLIIVLLALVLAHSLSAFVILCALIFVILAKVVCEKLCNGDTSKINIGCTLVTLFGVLMFAQWVYRFYEPSRSFLDVLLGGLFQSIRTGTRFTGTAFIPSDFLLNRVGFLILMGLLVIGTLAWLHPSQISKAKIAIIAATGGLSIMTYAPTAFNIENFIAGRWPVFVSIAGAPLIAQGVLSLSRLARGKVAKLLLVSLFLFVFSWFMINSAGVNLYTPFYGEQSLDPVRYALTQSELKAVDTISQVYDGNITSDGHYVRMVLVERGGCRMPIYLDAETESEGMVVIRRYIYTHHFEIRHYEKLNQDFWTHFDGPAYNLIYNNNNVSAYLQNREGNTT